MVDSIKPITKSFTEVSAGYKPGTAATAVAPTDDKAHRQPLWMKVDRRKTKDRRLLFSSKHPKFEMRLSSGRRKEDRLQPSIETKA